MTLRIETENGKVLSALYKYCYEMECNDFMWEASFVRIQ